MFKSIRHSLKEAVVQIFRNKGMSFTSLFSITAMLLILGLFFVLTVNVNYTSEKVKDQFDTIELFLKDHVTEAKAQALSKSLGQRGEISNIEYISKDQAMTEFKVRWGSNSYLLDSLNENPLPNSLRLTLSDLSYGDSVAEMCRTYEEVEDVRYYQSEVSKIIKISGVIQKAALVISLFLVVVSIVVVSNTVKLTVMARQDEIAIMKYVGATNWFVRGPLLCEGMILGFIGACAALAITGLVYSRLLVLIGPGAMQMIGSSPVEAGFMIKNVAWIFGALGVGIGAFGSIASIRRFLHV